jgi:hypothetical protein
MEKKEDKPRKRVVVEEVVPAQTLEVKAQIEEPVSTVENPKSDTPKEEIEEAVHHENESSRIPEKFAPKAPEKPSSGGKYILLLIPLLLILAALGGGIYVFTKGVAAPSEEATPEPTIEETITPSPTPTATPSKADLAKYAIALQNGSGIAGEATKAQKVLTDAGFKVSSIGNAKTYDYEETIIKAKSGINQAYLSQLSTTLGKTYEVGENETLAESEKTDILVIVGKTKAD